MAHNYLSSLLRCGCDLLRICDGANTAGYHPKSVELEDYITIDHIEAMNKVIVLTGSIVGIAYLTELFIAWYGQNPYESYAFYAKQGKPFQSIWMELLADDVL